MSHDSTSHAAGDYRLIELVSENERSRVWLAEQTAIGRKVLVEELRPEQAERRDEFMADARAKAAVDDPLVATVYEAVADDERCFFARELLSPRTLEALRQAGASLQPTRMAHVIRRLAEAQIHHETAGQATSAPGLEHIHVDDHEVVRLDNLALAGGRDPSQSAADIARLGSALPRLVAKSRPGSTRVLTLLSWMRGEHVDTPLDWRQVTEVCLQIEQQLAKPATAIAPTQPMKRRTRKLNKGLAAAITLPALALIFALVWIMRPNDRAKPQPPVGELQTVVMDAGRHSTPDGQHRAMPAFRITASEVSVGQYKQFLETLETVTASGGERSFDHREQPMEKTTHVPDNWQQQLAGPRHLPVTGVDWWDAAAFSAWKKGRLPSQEEWFAAVCGSPAVQHSVREWTSPPAVDPANPLGAAKWVLIRRPRSDSPTAAREWVDDRSLRAPDLGFRLCFDAE